MRSTWSAFSNLFLQYAGACPTSAGGNLVRARQQAPGPAVCSTHGALSVPSVLPPPYYSCTLQE
eukprot:1713348-Prymnesium_polylepis.1